MSCYLHAVAETYHGSTDVFIEPDHLRAILVHIADDVDGGDSLDREGAETVDVCLNKQASEHFLDLLEHPDQLRKSFDEAIDELGLTVDREDLSALLNNMHMDRAEYRSSYERDRDTLRFRIDYF